MVNLKKGETAVIKANRFIVGLGWDTRCDLDAHAYLYEEKSGEDDKNSEKKGLFSRKIKSSKEKEHIYFMHKKSSNGAVILTGDNLTGEGDGDDEQIIVNLDLLSDSINRICFKVEIFSGTSSFSAVKGAFIRIVDSRSEEICRYDLSTSEIKGREYTFGNLVKQNGEWFFKADE